MWCMDIEEGRGEAHSGFWEQMSPKDAENTMDKAADSWTSLQGGWDEKWTANSH